MQQESVTIGLNNFRFEKLSFINAIKFQQKLLNKVDLKEIKAVLSDNGLEGLTLENLITLFLSILKQFNGDELVNTITELLTMSKTQVMTETGEFTLPSLEKCFSDNFNQVFELLFEILKLNYKGFFLEKISAGPLETIPLKKMG